MELIPEKKRMGRPPLPEDEKKVRLHISVSPQIAAAAKKWKRGVSDYFETSDFMKDIIESIDSKET